ncbi:hypothetical protein [Alloacidobacterium sp.]|uniref:hypothetical protein n=1 Tax=Alloacidobacterium sp. TaxID=2951999 RepID=UPI002D36760E|nr:hypothetical protein [Alloacidobacterium sp.]HYK37713.1 hypothetical protein [Alloacidobacterium sp.]
MLLFSGAVCTPVRAQQSLPDAPEATIELVATPEPGQFPPAAPDPPKSTLSARPPFPSVQAVCIDTQSKASPVPKMSCGAAYDPFQKFINSAEQHPMTPKQKAILAGKDVIDPFNFLTIGMISVYSVAVDSHSPYGPGVEGIAKLSAVSLTQDMTNEFFGTFLVPSIVHQDPHYHRMPNAGYKRRIAHCIYQVVWTQGDNGKGMFNYANVVGGLFEEAIGDAYVPYRDTGWGASAARYGTALGTDPIGNFITEFFPDLARHINFNVVFVQRVINRVAVEESQ